MGPAGVWRQSKGGGGEIARGGGRVCGLGKGEVCWKIVAKFVGGGSFKE